MLRSMTTFARVEPTGDDWSSTIELRSVNARFCDIRVRLPNWMNPLEDRIKKLVRERLVRGHIDLSIVYEGSETPKSAFEPDLELGRSYLSAARKLADGLGIENSLDLSSLLGTLEGAIVVREQQADIERTWERIKGPLMELLDEAVAMSLREGTSLERDLGSRLSQIEDRINSISRQADGHLKRAQEALMDKIQSILKDVPIDEGRMAQEMALLANKLDITEEIVRAHSHIGQFRSYLEKEEIVGRRLDFLLQELFREINTMASKSSDSMISQSVVEIKDELEKMREQVQNIV